MNIQAWLEATHIPGVPALGLVAIAIFMVLLSTALAVFIIVQLPHDYFSRTRRQMLQADPNPLTGAIKRIGKNLAGWLLILMGIILSLPAVPGQGILTGFMGVVLIDFPGKSRLEQKVIRIGWIHRTFNQVRARFNRAPLTISGS